MARRTFETLSREVRQGLKQTARQHALFVPWRRLEETVTAFVDWHIFLLWVRSATEFEERVPEYILEALELRCPEFLASCGPREHIRRTPALLWRNLEGWIAKRYFSEAKQDGWFDALMFYAYSDLRVEQAWAVWHQSRDLISSGRIQPLQNFADWSRHVDACNRLVVDQSDKAHAVRQLLNVDPSRLEATTTEVIQRRGRALWLGYIAESNRDGTHESLERELHRYTDVRSIDAQSPLLFRLIRVSEQPLWATARAEGWNVALHYRFLHSSRYHRLLHFVRKCLEEGLEVDSSSHRSFEDWFRAMDEYVVPANPQRLGSIA